MATYFNVSTVCPDAERAPVEAAMMAAYGGIAAKPFEIGLSASGSEPATHWGGRIRTTNNVIRDIVKMSAMFTGCNVKIAPHNPSKKWQLDRLVAGSTVEAVENLPTLAGHASELGLNVISG